MPPAVSFIVPTLDRPAALRRFLASADAQRRDDYEVIVIDRGALGAEALASHRHVRYFQSPLGGLSASRNVGLARAQGALVAFADDDCVLSEDYLETVTRAATRLTDPLVFGFGNAVTLEDGGPVVPTFQMRSRIGSWKCDTLCSISLVFNRATFDRLGGFDEAFGMGARFPAAEETDLLLRIIAAGGRGVGLPGLTIRHPRRARTADLVERYRQFGLAQGALAHKHAGNLVFLARFGYSLIRSAAGVVLAAVRRNGLASMYAASLGGKLSGFFGLGKAR